MANERLSSSSFFTYDVFFSFNPSDTTNGFTANLSQAFQRRGIKSFMETRDEITPDIFNLIVKSKSAVILLSENYASSSRCLEELAYILNNFDHATRSVCPIFYDVKYYEVRGFSGAYGEALARHEKNLKDNKGKLLKWKNALFEVTNLPRFHFQHGVGYDETAFIMKIVKEVSRKHYYAPLPNEDHLVGLEDPLEEVCSLMDLESDSVLKIGIFGMSGVGKTTLAGAVYNRIAHQFEGHCFLYVKGNAEIVHLQNKLLFDIVGEDIQIESAHRGASLIKEWLQQKKVLLILDDVDRLEQLEALVGGQDWFGSGSRVIITTRNRHLLAYQGVEITYNVKKLNDKYAYDLFILKAFGKRKVEPIYAELSYQIVAYAEGLPLTLKMLGSFLHGRSVDEWRTALARLNSTPDKKNDIQKVLRISFDNLGDDEKSVFLDIACCFKGYELTEVNKILCAHYGYNVKYHVDVLIGKSLITISSLDGKVKVHELIENMAKEIVRRESPDPGKHSRLWSHDDILDILKTNKGTDKIQIIHLDPPLIGDEVIKWDAEAFKKMENLKTLIIRKCHFSNAPKHFPSSLRVLQWWNYPSQELPCDFDPKQLVICMVPGLSVTPPQPFELFETCKRAARVMLQVSVRVLQAEATWRLVGLVSSVVGLLCYALSPSFNRLIGGWNSFKGVLYAVFSLVIITTILFGKESSLSTQYVQYKAYMKFAVLMIISLYSFFYDNAVSGKPEIRSVVSNAAFALMSLSLSKLVKFGFEIGMFSYFLGCLVIQLWTIDRKLILVAIIFGCPLFVMQSSLDFEPEVSNGSQVINSNSQTMLLLTNRGQDIHLDIDSSSDATPEVNSGGEHVINVP
ncbi:disease resistance protein Roq1-like [Vicia villosa]|uniref:disease resistance protein Roq1-like n=1 Tax=Vicia villosa TaxID=3911 RepID=UPI00273AA7B6|nr:disease resistance protein Roq1-like [Vicia villosa]XP_058771101.1 disease resistance protein Roq1-like [Vicia villosa]